MLMDLRTCFVCVFPVLLKGIVQVATGAMSCTERANKQNASALDTSRCLLPPLRALGRPSFVRLELVGEMAECVTKRSPEDPTLCRLCSKNLDSSD